MMLTIIFTFLFLSIILIVYFKVRNFDKKIKKFILSSREKQIQDLELCTTDELISALTMRDHPPLVVAWQDNDNKEFNYFLFRNEKISPADLEKILKKIYEDHKNL